MVMTMKRHGRLMLAVLHQADPSDAEWNSWVELGLPLLGAQMRGVLEVYGPHGPSARQRRVLTPYLTKIDMRTAILSDSVMVRGVVTAFSWLGVPNSAFSPSQLDEAARYLELTPDERALAAAQLPGLRSAAGVVRKTPRFSLRSGPPGV